MNNVKIAMYSVGTNEPCFVIAEAGVNHNGDLKRAFELVDVAFEAGANAIKFQTFKASRLVTADAPKANYQLQATDVEESQYEMLRRLELSLDDHRELVAYCDSKGVLFMSTPFDELSADFLNEIDVPVFKIPSGEITNLPFLTHVARFGKPLILSTGMSYLGEVEAAVQAINHAGNQQLIILHCVSNYPADPIDINLRAMDTIRQAFGYPTGYSDHTMGAEISLAAVARGACVIEKHFTLDRNLPGPDHRASLEPDELKALVSGIRNVEMALGHGRKIPAASEANTASVARKSLVAAHDIQPGAVVTREDIATKRPGTGLQPSMLAYLIGRKAKSEIAEGTPFSLEMLV
ncbi:MAG: N-acetylneuraminate synthase [Anaerolineae bacterium]